MKAKTFENLIRKIVREEIDYALRRELKTLKEDIESIVITLNEDLRDDLKPTITEHTERLVEVPDTPRPQMSEEAKSSLKQKIMGSNPIPKKPVVKQNFTTNSALNDLLNETAQGSTNLESGNAPVSMAQPFSSGAPLPTDTTGMPPEVAEAVTRDYSGLMKAIEKKKGK